MEEKRGQEGQSEVSSRLKHPGEVSPRIPKQEPGQE